MMSGSNLYFVNGKTVTYDSKAGHTLRCADLNARSLSSTGLSQALLVTGRSALAVVGHTVVSVFHVTGAKLGVSGC